KLAAGTAIMAALGVCAYAHFHFGPPNDNTAPQTAELSAAVQPVPATSVQAALNASRFSSEAAGSESASSWTEVLPAEPVDASAKAEPVQASQKVEPEASQKAEPSGLSQKMVSA